MENCLLGAIFCLLFWCVLILNDISISKEKQASSNEKIAEELSRIADLFEKRLK